MIESSQELPIRIEKTNFLPPWLWCWLLLYIAGFFHNYTYIGKELAIIFASKDLFVSKNAFLSIDIVGLSLTIGEFVPLLAIFAGIILVFLPWLRVWWLRKRYNIQSIEYISRIAPETTPALTDVETFIHIFAPEVSVTYAYGAADRRAEEDNQASKRGLSLWWQKRRDTFNNLFVTQLSKGPITYATGYFRSGITVSSKLLETWKYNRQKAQELLLHELAHHYNGDAAIVGAGSLLEVVSRGWLWLAIIFTIIPSIILEIIHSIVYFLEFGLIYKISSDAQHAVILHILQGIWMYDIPALLLNILLSILWNATIFAMLIVAIWCAELNADRFARDNTHSTTMLADEDKAVWKWLFANINHPPHQLRKWASRQEGTLISSLLLILFPISLFLYLLLLIAQNFVYGLPLLYSESISSLLKLLGDGVITYLQGIIPLLLCMAVIILVWPACANVWTRIFHRGKERETRILTRTPYKAYIISTAFVLCCCIPGSILSALPTSKNITDPYTPVTPTATLPTATIPTDKLPLPTLAQSYKGTLTNTINGKQSQITLSEIVQNRQGGIQGSMTIAAPLAEKGTFSGSVTDAHAIQFKFTPEEKTADAVIQFSGTVQKDGTLIGFYTITGTGEVGSWQTTK